MSLTSHLKNPRSPVHSFIQSVLPRADRVVRQTNVALAQVPTLQPAGPVPLPLLGTAFDYRVRYYFQTKPVHQLVAFQGAQLLVSSDGNQTLNFGNWPDIYELVGLKPLFPLRLAQAFFRQMSDEITQLRPAGRRLDESSERVVARYCLVLALFDQIQRSGLAGYYQSPLSTIKRDATLTDLLRLAKQDWIEDMCQLSTLFYERSAAQLLQPAVCNPTFTGSAAVGGADADLIIGRSLVELKARSRPLIETQDLEQLIGYALLDTRNRYGIDDLAIYLARQGMWVRWSLPELLREGGGTLKPQSISKLRRSFSVVLKQLEG